MGSWNEKLREPRMGIMLHYDASTSDRGAVQWLLYDPRCKVSYNFLILDNGQRVNIAPVTARAWHAGVCRTSDPRLPYHDANSAFWGISIAATAGETVTAAAKRGVVELCRTLFKRQGWDEKEDVYRIVGHASEAWPRGRKVDPEGPNLAKPVMSTAEIREMVASQEPLGVV